MNELKKFKNTIQIKGKVKIVTGLHIGAGSEVLEIGGLDNPVVKHPHTGEPYIPGSSLKGKMRSLMEWKLGKIYVEEKDKNSEKVTRKEEGKVHCCLDPKCPICRIFGSSAGERDSGPTRLIVRDSMITEEIRNKRIALTEEKRENTINRITAEAKPRFMERVVSGIEFEIEILLRQFESDKIDDLDYVLQALALVEMDALGGYGSRGSGKVKFDIDPISELSNKKPVLADYLNKSLT